VSEIRGVVCDFGGVLTTPLHQAFAAMQEESGISSADLGRAMQRVAERDGEHPLFELEKGKITEERFLTSLSDALEEEVGERHDLSGFGQRYFSNLNPNGELIEYMRSLRSRGLRMAILTNNVREWEPRWRSMLPVDEIFELVVDSGFVGMRKPDPAIYELTLERLGLAAAECLFVDDTQINVDAAAQLGFTAILFESNEQAIAAVEAALEADAATDFVA
jgi:epoxide hydrolase-like predicted phosphatase